MSEQIKVWLLAPKSNRPFYSIEWQDPITGKMHRKSTKQKSRRKAREVLAAKQSELERDSGVGNGERVTWGEFREAYTLENENRPKGTLANIVATLTVVEEIINPAFLDSLNSYQIIQFLKGLRTRPARPSNPKKLLSVASVNRRLRTLKAALRWAEDQRMIAEAPRFPKLPGSSVKAKARAVTGEELDRMIDKVSDVVGPEHEARWRFLLQGLNLSGLRLGESLRLRWGDGPVQLTKIGGRWAIRFEAEGHKNRKATIAPITPDFAGLLETVPKEEQSGRVFPIHFDRLDTVSKTITAIGKEARVKTAPGKHGSAHDLRRAFGTRWATRVVPTVLMQLMRHNSVQTTMDFYAGSEVEAVNLALYGSPAKSPDVLPDASTEKQ